MTTASVRKVSKRIHKVTIKRMVDESPDTSWLGEYADHPTSEFSIDRGHSLECVTQPCNLPIGEGLRVLESANKYVSDYYNDLQATELTNSAKEDRLVALDDADTILTDIRNGNAECDCRVIMERNQYRYFNGPVENYKGESPEDIREYVRQDYERIEGLQRGDWCFIGIRAEAVVKVQIGESKYSREFDPSLNQTITSGGLWGIESNSDASYLAEIEQEQLAELRSQLEAIGFSKRAVSAAFRNVERKDA